MLINLGMYKNQAHEVIEEAKPQIDEQMKIHNHQLTWDRPAKEYPDIMFTFLIDALKPFAYSWYERNLPNAWNKDVFKTDGEILPNIEKLLS